MLNYPCLVANLTSTILLYLADFRFVRQYARAVLEGHEAHSPAQRRGEEVHTRWWHGGAARLLRQRSEDRVWEMRGQDPTGHAVWTVDYTLVQTTDFLVVDSLACELLVQFVGVWIKRALANWSRSQAKLSADRKSMVCKYKDKLLIHLCWFIT